MVPETAKLSFQATLIVTLGLCARSVRSLQRTSGFSGCKRLASRLGGVFQRLSEDVTFLMHRLTLCRLPGGAVSLIDFSAQPLRPRKKSAAEKVVPIPHSFETPFLDASVPEAQFVVAGPSHASVELR
jgi:hypothetical protein